MDSSLVERMNRVGAVLGQNGADAIQALLMLVIGLVALHWFMRWLKSVLDKTKIGSAKSGTVLGCIYIMLLTFVLATVLVQLGADSRNIMRGMIIVSLLAIAVIILIRPYIPTLPFKVGNTVKVGGLLGKIEATTLVHTRMRTFDGKTVFIPNEKILRDFIINYQITPTRRIKIDIPIRHIKDILRTKQLLEAIMVEDPRVLAKPARPVVYTLNLVEGCVEKGLSRCIQTAGRRRVDRRCVSAGWRRPSGLGRHGLAAGVEAGTQHPAGPRGGAGGRHDRHPRCRSGWPPRSELCIRRTGYLQRHLGMRHQ